MSSTTRDDELFSRARKAMCGAREFEFDVVEVVAEMERENVARTTGYPSVERLLEDLLRVDRRDAKRMVRHARALVAGVAASGEPLTPSAPATATAAAEGAVSSAHVEVVLDTMERLDRVPGLEPGVLAAAEHTLAEAARTLPPRGVRKVAARLRGVLDPDGLVPADPPEPDDELYLASRRDGSLSGRFHIHGLADHELVREAFDALSGPAGPDDHRSLDRRRAEAFLDLVAQAVAPTGIAATDSEPDADTEPHDVHSDTELDDGHSDTGAGGAASGDGPGTSGPTRPAGPHRRRGAKGCPPSRVLGRGTLTVTMDLRWLQQQNGHAVLDSENAISAAEARRIACDAGVVPVVLGGRSQPLDVGRLSYTLPEGMRRALVLRDGGCAFPGCTRRPGRCAAHHVIHWADGGATALDNTTLLCRYHHHLIHHGDWRIQMRDGRPWFVPPRWLDPERTPRPGGRHPGRRRSDPGRRRRARLDG